MKYLLALLLVVSAAAHAQQLYRWTDKDGKVHYGQNPPSGVVAKPVKNTTSSVQSQTPVPTQSSETSQRDGERKPRFDPRKQY